MDRSHAHTAIRQPQAPPRERLAKNTGHRFLDGLIPDYSYRRVTLIDDACCSPAEFAVTVIVTVVAGFTTGCPDAAVALPPPPQPICTSSTRASNPSASRTARRRRFPPVITTP